MCLGNSDKIKLHQIRELLRYSLILEAIIAILLFALIMQGEHTPENKVNYAHEVRDWTD